MTIEQLLALTEQNLGTLVFALFGAVCMTVLSIKEHSDRKRQDKMSRGRYFLHSLGWAIGYPLLAFGAALAYLASGNDFGPMMSWQIGLTSPGILAGVAGGGANLLAKKGIPTVPGQ